MQENNKWILHSEQQPEAGQYVFYYFEHTGVSYGRYDGANTYYGRSGFLCGDVTHWMPAPEPPKSYENIGEKT